MEPVAAFASKQYRLVKGSRDVLFTYCQTISPDDFLAENSSFGRGGSIRNLLVHIANTYEFWIDKTSLQKEILFTPYETKRNISEVIALFAGVDKMMFAFIEVMQTPALKEIGYTINGTNGTTDAISLFSHVITHEFHHKGQILSISRHLGYTPVDTDIMR